ncbi:MAG: mechanosensitive ion channel family protein [Alkalispirochaetaceae bacterium]
MKTTPVFESIGLSALPVWVELTVLVLAGALGYWLLSTLAPLLLKKERATAARAFLRSTRTPVWIIIAVLIVDWGVRSTRPGTAFEPFLGTAVPLIVVFALGLLSLRVSDALFELLRRRFDIKAIDNLRARKATTQINLLQQVITFIIIIISVSAALMTIPGVRSYGASLLASAGVAGIVLGFAAQQTLANILAGIQLAITQPLRYDDAVVIDGEWGWVEETALTYIVVRLWDRRRLIVPISQLLQSSFQNWTRSTSSIIGTVHLHLDYTTDLEEIRKVQTAALMESDLWNREVDVVQVVDTTETTMVVRSLVSAKDSPTTWDLRCYLRERLITHLREAQPQALPKRRYLEAPEPAETDRNRPESEA